MAVPKSRRYPTIRLECGNLAWIGGPRFGPYYVCDYCSRDALAEDSTADEVWCLPKGKQTAVMRKLPKPKAKYPELTEPLFNPESPDDVVPF